MSIQKLLEINSQFRNRQQWKNPFCFSIPVQFSRQFTHYIDPVCLSMPIKKFVCLPTETKLKTRLQLVNGWNFFSGSYAQELNAYKGATINGFKILNSFSTPYVLAIEVNILGTPISSPLIIRTITNFTLGLMHLPGITEPNEFYKNWIIRNETLETHTKILHHLESILWFDPQINWTVEHQYTLHQTYKSPLCRTMSTTNDDLVSSDIPVPFESIGHFLRIKSSGKVATILEILPTQTQLRVYPTLPHFLNEVCEIFPISFDNFQPIEISPSIQIRTLELLSIFLPNIKLKNENSIHYHQTLYINITVNGSRFSNHYSNAPGFTKANFIVQLYKIHHMYIEYRPPISSIVDCSGTISEFFICVQDTYGSILEPACCERKSPEPPNLYIQTKFFVALST